MDQYFIYVLALNKRLAVENPMLSPSLLAQNRGNNTKCI